MLKLEVKKKKKQGMWWPSLVNMKLDKYACAHFSRLDQGYSK